jgi:integrase
MAKRRGHGEGSVYQIKDGRWVTSISTGDRKRKYLYSKTQKEALEKLTKARYEQQQGRLVNSPRQSLKVYLTWWLDEVYKPTVRLSTYYKRQLAIKNHIIPALGHISLQALTPKDVQAFYAKKMREEPRLQNGKKKSALKPQSVKNLHTILHMALGPVCK